MTKNESTLTTGGMIVRPIHLPFYRFSGTPIAPELHKDYFQKQFRPLLHMFKTPKVNFQNKPGRVRWQIFK